MCHQRVRYVPDVDLATASSQRFPPERRRRSTPCLSRRRVSPVSAKGPEHSRQHGRARPVPVAWSGAAAPGHWRLSFVNVTPGGLVPIEL